MSEKKAEAPKVSIGDKVKFKDLVCEVVNVDGDQVCIDDREISDDGLKETKASTHRQWHKASDVTKEK
jgi:hypothetical protein